MPELSSPADAPGELLAIESRHLMPCLRHFYRDPPLLVTGSSCTLVDHLGRRYVDCTSGVGVMSAGHGNPAIIEPAIAQIRRLQHTTSIYLTEPVVLLAQRLAALAPGGLRRSFFCASGSEAVEGALLLAARHTSRPAIVSMSGSLHGRTRWANNATRLPMWRADPFPLPDMHEVPFGDAQALAQTLARHGSRIAAVIGEPVQGNGGIIVPPADYWPGVRELCDTHGTLLVFDEVLCGLGRTGRTFACEHWSVAPDILCLSKALGNGFPIAAILAGDEVAASYDRPAASTFGGNPVSARAALATLDFHAQADLPRRARQHGARFLAGLRDLHRRHRSCYEEPRGLGLMLGLPVIGASGPAAAARCDDLLEALKERGVLAGKAGPGRDVLTFMPPLVIGEEEISEVLDALDDATAACA